MAVANLAVPVVSVEVAERRIRVKSHSEGLTKFIGSGAMSNIDLVLRVAGEWDEALEMGLVDLEDEEAKTEMDWAFGCRGNVDWLLAWTEKLGWM